MTSEGFWLLARAMFGNLAEDRRALTIAQANGVGIGMGGEKVHREWLAAQDVEPTPIAKGESAAAAQQLGVLMRLQQRFASQGPGLRNAIRFKKPD